MVLGMHIRLCAEAYLSAGPRNRGMDQEQKEALIRIIHELTEVKYELSLYVDEGLIDLGERFDKALTKLNDVTNTPAPVSNQN